MIVIPSFQERHFLLTRKWSQSLLLRMFFFGHSFLMPFSSNASSISLWIVLNRMQMSHLLFLFLFLSHLLQSLSFTFLSPSSSRKSVSSSLPSASFMTWKERCCLCLKTLLVRKWDTLAWVEITQTLVVKSLWNSNWNSDKKTRKRRWEQKRKMSEQLERWEERQTFSAKVSSVTEFEMRGCLVKTREIFERH